MLNYKLNIFIISLIYFVHNSSTVAGIDPLVASKVGLIRGLRASDGDYSMFMGIPYATVNESNPFGPSVPHTRFENIFEAYNDSAICPQVESHNNTIVGSLDCLHINIYVPNKADSLNKLPVLVFIHGGAFKRGFSGRYVFGPRYLVEQDIVLVTLNYRVGPYGFMCLHTPDVPGNQGLKDQALALRWIKNNIDEFGGDSNKITLMGQSAGGVSIELQLMFNKEQLFDKVIMQSGVGLCPWSVAEPDVEASKKLAEKLGLTTANTKEALQFLATVDPKLVIAATTELDFWFLPCVEKQFDEVKQFIYEYPVNMKTQNIGNTSILLGYNAEELFAEFEIPIMKEHSFLNIFHGFLKENFNFKQTDLSEMESQITQFYIGDEKISETVKSELIKFDSDTKFNYPVVRTINKYLDNGAINIYHYVFSYDGGRNYIKRKLNITTPGVTHADELSYIFDVSFLEKNPSPEDRLMIDRIIKMWVNFAKYGNPTPQVNELLPVQWPTVTKNQFYYLNINSELKVEKRNYHDRMALWNLFYKLNERYQLGYKIKN